MTSKLNLDSMAFIETTQASFNCSDLENPMSEGCKDAIRLDLDRKLKVEFHKIIVVVRRKLWSLTVYLGNVRLIE